MIEIDGIPWERKWAMAARALTGALSAHLEALYQCVGKEKYAEVIGQIWKEIGKGSAGAVRQMDMKVDNAKEVGEAGVTICLCAMGPEYKIEWLEAAENKAVFKVVECPWKNRMNESGISHDLLSACDTAFWGEFVQNLNANVKMKHGRQMHRGDPYCEWIFERNG